VIEVIMEADLRCPRCVALEPVLRRICSELDIPFTVKYMSLHSVAAYEDSSILHTFSPEWIERFGLPEHRKSLKKIKPILDYIQRNKVSMVPVVRIRWFDGLRWKEVAIRGYDPNDPNSRQFISNIYALLRMLRRTVFGI